MQIRRSIVITFLSSNFNMTIMFVVTLIAARLLQPEDVGLFSIAVVCINVFAVLRDLGTDAYLQQTRELDRRKVASVLGLTLVASWVLGGLLFLTRHQLAAWFNEPGLAAVLEVLLCSFLLVPYAAVLVCLLQRDMKAEQLACAGLVGTTAFAITCLTLASQGAGASALAWANFANVAGALVVYALIRPPTMAWWPRFGGWLEPVKFGFGAMIGHLSRVTYQGVPDLALGRFQGAHEVGLFSRANGLVGLFQQVVGPTVTAIALPALAKQHHAKVPVGPQLERACAYLTVLAWPAFCWVALFPAEIIEALYGRNWIDAAGVVRWLCVAAAVKVGYQLVQPALVAIGRPYAGAGVLLLGLVLRVVCVLAWGTSGLEGFILAIVMADLLTLPYQVWLARRLLGFGLMASWRAHAHSLRVLSVFALVGLLFKVTMSDALGPLQVTLGSGLVLLVTWLVAVHALRHPFAHEVQLLWQSALRKVRA